MGRLLTERADATAYPSEVGITFTYAYGPAEGKPAPKLVGNALGRIVTMVDASGTTTHSYDARGNLLSKTNAAGTLTYDNLYRLRSEIVTDDPNGNNGTVTYGLDLLGNSESRISTLPGVPDQTNLGYDASNRLESDDYDANGNTLWTTAETFMGELPVMADRYDSQNRLIRRATDAGIVDLIYDGDGNRVGKIVSGFSSLPSALKTTWYLVDTQNLTLEGCFQRDEMDAFFRVVSKDPSAKPDFHGCPVSVRRGSVVSAATATFGSRGKPRDHGRVPNRRTTVMGLRSWMTLVF